MNDTINDYDVVALLCDLPQEGLSAGQTGAVMMTHNQGEAFEVEFILQPRRSVVATVYRNQLLKLKGLGYPAKAG